MSARPVLRRSLHAAPPRILPASVAPLLPVTTVLLAACGDPPSAPDRPSFAIQDGERGGNASFFWLPPLVPQPTFSGTFDATLSPEVRICELNGTTCHGAFLVFTRDNDVWLLDLRAGGVRRLTNAPEQYKAVGGVSPDGKRIVFTRIDPGRLEQIFVMSLDGRQVTRVSRGDDYDFLPRWSPDGQRIAFTSVRDGTNGIYSMRADGSDVRDLSRTPQSLAMQPGRTMLQVNESLWAWMKY